MAWYDIDIYVGRPATKWDTTLGTLAPGALQSWHYNYGADTQRGTHPPKSPTFSFELLLGIDDAELKWSEGDRCIARISYGTQAAFTYFVGALEQPTFDHGTGVTVVSCRAYGLLAFLPRNVSLEVHEDDDTGALFDALLETAGLPSELRRADSTLDRTLERYLANETNLIKELQRIVDTQGPPGIWYQTWDGAILAHARGTLDDALTVGGIADLQPLTSIKVEHDLRNIVNFVSVDVVNVNVQSSTRIRTVRSATDTSTPRRVVIAQIAIADIDYDFISFSSSGVTEYARVIADGLARISGVVTDSGGGSVTVRARRYVTSSNTTTVTSTIEEEDIDSIARFDLQALSREIFGGLDESDIRELAKAFLRQYAFGLTQRSFDLRVTPDNLATLLGDGTDFSGLYIGRPIVIFNRGEAALGRISRVSIGANSPALVARIETDSYISGELLFVPSSFMRQLAAGAAYSIQIPPALGGVSPITYALASGPNYASFDVDTRIVSGTTPNYDVTKTVVIRATDSTPNTVLGTISADFILTLETSGGGPRPPAPDFNWRFDTLASFNTYFTTPAGTNFGHWESEASGSTSSRNTGPSPNNVDSFVHTEANSSSSTSESSMETNGLATATDDANDTLNDRDIIIRYCFQSNRTGTRRSLHFQGKASSDTDWTTIATLYAWAYAASRDDGDSVTDYNGDTFTVAQDGGWRDVTVSTGDYDEYRLAPDYDFNIYTQDIALHSIQSA